MPKRDKGFGKGRKHRGKKKMKKLIFVVLVFLVIGGYMIAKNSELDISEEGDRGVFLKSFGTWIKGLGRNVKDVAGYAVKDHDWLPEVNETNNNKTGDINEEA